MSDRIVYFFEIENKVIEYSNAQKCKVVIDKNDLLKINIVAMTVNGNDIIEEICNLFGVAKEQTICKIWDEFPLNANGKVDKMILKNG